MPLGLASYNEFPDCMFINRSKTIKFFLIIGDFSKKAIISAAYVK